MAQITLLNPYSIAIRLFSPFSGDHVTMSGIHRITGVITRAGTPVAHLIPRSGTTAIFMFISTDTIRITGSTKGIFISREITTIESTETIMPPDILTVLLKAGTAMYGITTS
jgi:antitoxin (DNA-binding transcriptional repressor) of toxin-antitoxin stability system